MYLYIQIYKHTYIYIHTAHINSLLRRIGSVYIRHTHIYVYGCIYTYTFIYIYICVYTHTYICIWSLCPYTAELLDISAESIRKIPMSYVLVVGCTTILCLKAYLSLRGYRYLRLDGGTSSEERQTRLALYNQEHSPYFLFILSTKAGGLSHLSHVACFTFQGFQL